MTGSSRAARGPVSDGQREGKSAAVAGFAFHPDASAVIFDNLLANGQAQAGAFRLVGQRIAHLLELLKDLRLIGGSNADAGVSDAQQPFRLPC